MDALTHGIVVLLAGLFLISLMLRRIPIVGPIVRLVIRLMLIVSPLMVGVVGVAIIWFHGSSLFSVSSAESSAVPVIEAAAEGAPERAPQPPERPDG